MSSSSWSSVSVQSSPLSETIIFHFASDDFDLTDTDVVGREDSTTVTGVSCDCVVEGLAALAALAALARTFGKKISASTAAIASQITKTVNINEQFSLTLSSTSFSLL